MADDDIRLRIITNENGELDRLNAELRAAAAGEEALAETEATVDLHLTKAEFAERMKQEPNGWALLCLLEDGEWRVCERMGLCNGYIQDGVVYIDVPAWKNLVAHLQLVNGV